MVISLLEIANRLQRREGLREAIPARCINLKTRAPRVCSVMSAEHRPGASACGS